MKKSLFYAAAITFAVFLALTACEQSTVDGGPYGGGGDSGPVQISEKPSKKKALAGYEIDLNTYITVEPVAASNQTSFSVRAAGTAGRPVVWSIDNPADFGVTAEDVGDGVFIPAASATGAMKATATVLGGGEGGKDITLPPFTVTLIGESEYVAVTGITGARARSFAGASVDLGGAKVTPDDATYDIIDWSVKSPGGTGAAITAGRLNAASIGTLTMLGTVKSPKGDFTDDFPVQIMGMPKPWTKSAGVPAQMPNEIQTVCYGNGVFVAGSRENDGRIAWSDDGGVTWTGLDGAATTFETNFVHVRFLNGKFWAVGGDGHMAYSPDGKTWTAVAAPGITLNIVDIAWGEVEKYANGVFVAGGDSGAMSYSTDGGATWTANNQTATFTAGGSVADFKALYWAAGKFLAVGQFAKAVYSSDGIKWTNISDTIKTDIAQYYQTSWPSSSGQLGLSAITYGDGLYIIAGSGVLGLSRDLKNWERVDMYDLGFTKGHSYGWINSLIYADGLFVLGGADGKTAYSFDGKTWTLADTNRIFHNFHFINGLAYADGKFVAVGATCTADPCPNPPTSTIPAHHYGDVGCIAYIK